MSIPNFGIRFNFRIRNFDLGYVLGYARLPKTSLGYVLGYEAILGYDLLFWDTISNFGIRFGIRQANTAHAVEALEFRVLVLGGARGPLPPNSGARSLGFGVWNLEFRVGSWEFRVWNLGLRS